jgi:hypothetical protein
MMYCRSSNSATGGGTILSSKAVKYVFSIEFTSAVLLWASIEAQALSPVSKIARAKAPGFTRARISIYIAIAFPQPVELLDTAA